MVVSSRDQLTAFARCGFSAAEFPPIHQLDFLDDEFLKAKSNKMAPSKAREPAMEDAELSSAESGSGSESETENEKNDEQPRATKRRRLSTSSDDSYVAPAPLPTLSRIKKKDTAAADKAAEAEAPVSSRDALEIGLQTTTSSFESLEVAPWLVGALSAMAIKRPTAIQKACIPEILKGRDCIGGSRTGSGKTVAFAVPILQKWAQDPFGVFAVVLTPTRYALIQSG